MSAGRAYGSDGGSAGRLGFSLVEAVIALTLSALILGLVTTLFVAHSTYYRAIREQTEAQQNVRAVSELVRGELRTLTAGSFLVAKPDSMVFRKPAVIGMHCTRSTDIQYTYFPLDGLSVTAGEEKTGFAVRSSSGTWTYYERDWSVMYLGSGEFFTWYYCGLAGATTSAPSNNFVRLYIPTTQGGTISTGTSLMLWTQIRLSIRSSDLQSGRLALFRAVGSGSLVEFATGLTESTEFSYRVGGQYLSEVTGSSLSSIDAVRMVVQMTPQAGGDVYGWTFEIPLKNAESG